MDPDSVPQEITTLVGREVYSNNGVFVGEVEDLRLDLDRQDVTGLALHQLNRGTLLGRSRRLARCDHPVPLGAGRRRRRHRQQHRRTTDRSRGRRRRRSRCLIEFPVRRLAATTATVDAHRLEQFRSHRLFCERQQRVAAVLAGLDASEDAEGNLDAGVGGGPAVSPISPKASWRTLPMFILMSFERAAR